jgi:hypothetical protein
VTPSKVYLLNNNETAPLGLVEGVAGAAAEDTDDLREDATDETDARKDDWADKMEFVAV